MLRIAALRFTLAAVLLVGCQADTQVAAEAETGPVACALPSRARLPCGTDVPAATAILIVINRHALVVAVQPALAVALAARARFTWLALPVATAAMERVVGEQCAVLPANLVAGSGTVTLRVDAGERRGARVAALSRVRLGIDARAVAKRLPGGTCALAVRAALPIGARMTAFAAMVFVRR